METMRATLQSMREQIMRLVAQFLDDGASWVWSLLILCGLLLLIWLIALLCGAILIISDALSSSGSVIRRIFEVDDAPAMTNSGLRSSLIRGTWAMIYLSTLVVPVALLCGLLITSELTNIVAIWGIITLSVGLPVSIWRFFSNAYP